MELAQYHPNEIERLQKGAEVYHENQQRAAERGDAPSADQRRREQEALQKYA